MKYDISYKLDLLLLLLLHRAAAIASDCVRAFLEAKTIEKLNNTKNRCVKAVLTD